jgi:hypothetical protein
VDGDIPVIGADKMMRAPVKWQVFLADAIHALKPPLFDHPPTDHAGVKGYRHFADN